MLDFVAIDFELATADYNSVCAVGIVGVESGEIIKEYHKLIRPPENKYMWQTSRVHGIKPKHTADSPTFDQVFEEIEMLLAGKAMLAHNEKFDRSVLRQTLNLYKLSTTSFQLDKPWICTSELYQKLGFVRTKLSVCCELMNIPLNHHDPLSDARAAALLYLRRDEAIKIAKAMEI